jgi:hypothetical protein
VTVCRRLQCSVNYTGHSVYTASRRPAQHSAAIDNHYGAEVIVSATCSHSRWRVEEDFRVINLRFSSGLILCCEGMANWFVLWSEQDHISLNNGLDIRWNKYLKKKAVIVSLPTWFGYPKNQHIWTLMGRLPLHNFYLWRRVQYCRQRRHLYSGGKNLKYYLTPSPAVLPS